MSTVERLRKAARMIEIYGHRKGHFGNSAVGYCALGAIAHADARSDVYVPDIFGAWLRESDDEVISIVDWNDEPERTKEDVVEALRACADSLEESTS